MNRLKTKWKNIKADVRRRDVLVKKAKTKTGGGKLTPREQKIVDSQSFQDVATKMGVSASGNEARLDSDATTMPTPPTRRLARAFSSIAQDDESRMSFTESFDTESSERNDLDNSVPSIASMFQFSPRRSEVTSTVTSSTTTITKATANSNIRDIQLRNTVHLGDHLINMNKNDELQSQYLELQIERSKQQNARESIQTKILQAELDTVEALKQIEIQKARELAALEIEAKRKELNL